MRQASSHFADESIGRKSAPGDDTHEKGGSGTVDIVLYKDSKSPVRPMAAVRIGIYEELQMADQQLTCRDCGTSFTFTESEQQFFADKGFTNAPSRCSDCRRANRNSGGGGGMRSGGGRDRVMTDVTCSSCGKATQVPFVPTGNRPVYCSDCFSTQRGSSSGSSYGGGGERSRY